MARIGSQILLSGTSEQRTWTRNPKREAAQEVHGGEGVEEEEGEDEDEKEAFFFY